MLTIMFNAVETNPGNAWWENYDEVWRAWEDLKLTVLKTVEDDKFTLFELWDCFQHAQSFDRWLKEYQPEPEPEPEPEPDILKDKIVFGVEGAEHLESIKETGFNVVQSYTLIYRDDNRVKNFLDRCQSLGLKCIPSLSAVFQLHELPESKAKDFISKWKSHPAIYSWYTLDEPMLHKIDKIEQKRVYDFVKFWDSQIPVSMAIVSSNDEQMHKDHNCSYAYDILIADCYPISYWNKSGWDTVEQLENCFGQGVRNTKKYANGKSVIPLMQAFYDRDEAKHFKPHGTIKNQYQVWKNNGVKGNAGFYAWQHTKGPGLHEDKELREEVKDFLQK